jgi:Kef-type K+ transport system membrane component KefB
MNFYLNKNEAIDMFNDIIKFLFIAFTIHLLLFAVDDYDDLLSEFSLKIFLYIAVAILIYHLIIKKITNRYLKKKHN